MTTSFRPTPGQCYRDCFLLLEEHPDWVLVHGYPTLTGGPYRGRRYGHAWLERLDEQGLAWCVNHLLPDTPIPAPLFYLVGRIDAKLCRRYTLEEARLRALETGVYGDWGEPPPDVLYTEKLG